MTKYNSLMKSALATAALGCALLLFHPGIASAQSAKQKSAISLDLTMGVLSGGATELIYDPNVDGSSYKMSELDWASRPLVYWGLTANFNLSAGFYASFAVKSGIGGKTGYMQDSDWQNWDGVKTNFSEADSYTDQALILDIEGGYDFNIADSLKVGPFLKLGYLNFQWSARNGYLQYAPEYYPTTDSSDNYVYGPYTPISGNTPVIYVSGIGIVYQQSCFYPSIGLRATYTPWRRLTLVASFAVAPSVSMTETDNHVERGIIFTSTMNGGIVLEPRLVLRYQLSRVTTFGIDVSYIKIENLKGDLSATDSYGNDLGTDFNGAAASFEAIEGGVTLSMKL